MVKRVIGFITGRRYVRGEMFTLLARLLLVAVFLISPLQPDVTLAQSTQPAGPSALETSASASGLVVRWNAPYSASADQTQYQLDLQPFNGYLLPVQTVVVRLLEDTVPEPVIQQLATEPWHGALELAPALKPPVLDWQPAIPADPPAAAQLPDAPFFLLRSGYARGQHIAVYAFSELYQGPSGQMERVTSLEALAPNAVAVEPRDILAAYSMLPASGDRRQRIAGATPPINPLASQNAVKAFVSLSGIQTISAKKLAEAGLGSPNAATIRVFYKGEEIPLHILDYNRDGILAGNDSIRFYAPPPGDGLNSEDVYWLVGAGKSGKRMSSRNVSPAQASLRTIAYQTGVWSANKLYESTLPGPDGDNWFHAVTTTDPSDKLSDIPAVIANLDVSLPLAEASSLGSVFDIGVTAIDVDANGSAPAQLPHRLQLSGGSVNYADSKNSWVVDFAQGNAVNVTRTITTPGAALDLVMRLAPGAYTTRVYFDQIAWRMPVRLTFNSRGGHFQGVTGAWRYRLTNTPDKATLYDITNPRNPAILARSSGEALEFQDGPSPRDYILAGDGVIHEPRLQRHKPITLMSVDRAHAVYIAPEEFLDALNPLLAHRRNNGLAVAAIDVQQIYDGWSYGFVDPNAIREFLRYAVDAWSLPPISAVLVGDGTSDPRNYMGFNNANHIPSYDADVDPWLRVTACENCYAQLDGEDPLAESAFLADIWLGRFPVENVSELNALVNKIITYETAPDLAAPWRNLSIQLADDWVQTDGGTDGAGNFFAFIENVAKLQTPGIRIVRHYYNAAVDPALLDPVTRDWLRKVKPWIVTDMAQAQSRSQSLLNAGAGLVTYTGHANHWTWARMGPDPGYDFRLFGLWDVLSLSNEDELFVGLSMTCLTAQFTKPESVHTTLDEHLLLHPNGGAAAMWGPAGLSVATGHEALQTGFYAKLHDASSAPGETQLGSLIQSGYSQVVLHERCCQDVAKTFLLLGDPMTPLRFRPLEQLYLPKVSTAAADPASATSD